MTQTQVSKIVWYNVALMSLTSMHHIYGAMIYNTPWRLHVLILSLPVIALSLLIKWFLLKEDGKYRWALHSVLLFVSLVPSIGMIGIFEGLYNHVLKNIFFFAGASKQTLQSLFPAPTYEMPNDLIFEITGGAQGLMVVPIIILFTRLLPSIYKRKQDAQK